MLKLIPNYFPNPQIERTSQLATKPPSLIGTLKKCDFRLSGSEPLQIALRTPGSLGYQLGVRLSCSPISTDLPTGITPNAQPGACKCLWYFGENALMLLLSGFSACFSSLECRSSNPYGHRQTLLHGTLVSQIPEEPLQFAGGEIEYKKIKELVQGHTFPWRTAQGLLGVELNEHSDSKPDFQASASSFSSHSSFTHIQLPSPPSLSPHPSL